MKLYKVLSKHFLRVVFVFIFTISIVNAQKTNKVANDDYSCGVVSLSIVSKILDNPKTLQEIESMFPDKELQIASLSTLKQVATELQFTALPFKSTFEALEDVLKNEHAVVIVHTQNEFDSVHYSVALKIHNDKILILDPPKSPTWISRDDFISQWTNIGLLVFTDDIEIPKNSKNKRFGRSNMVHIQQASGKDINDNLSFLMDRYEVTRAEYALFLHATKELGHAFCHISEPVGKDHTPSLLTVKAKLNNPNSSPKEATQELLENDIYSSLPITGVDWFDAYAFANWSGKRLPTLTEWITVATNSGTQRYPWGNKWASNKSNVMSQEVVNVGSFPLGSTDNKIYDLHGNVGEWMANFAGGSSEKIADIVGSGFKSATIRDVDYRVTSEKLLRSDAVGFRCAADVDRENDGIQNLSTQSTTRDRGLVVPITSKDLGKVSTQTETTHRFYFRNMSNKPIKLLGVKSSCDCSAPKLSSDIIMPMGNGYLDVVFMPGIVTGNRTSNIVLETDNDITPNIVFTIVSEVVPGFFIIPNQIRLGKIFAGQNSEHKFKIVWPSNRRNEPVTFSTLPQNMKIVENTSLLTENSRAV
jgi:formylglycine-generating enzyme required for sulfatase activity